MKNPCHKEHIISLKRIEGQIRGVEKMINEEKYCIKILDQIKAIKNSLITVEGKILRTHLKECLKNSLSSSEDFDDKVKEIIKVLKR
tara:strand:- start:323 stop:583 length:261 start_codon:yes stop_codon:yes gene_type:complete